MDRTMLCHYMYACMHLYSVQVMCISYPLEQRRNLNSQYRREIASPRHLVMQVICVRFIFTYSHPGVNEACMMLL